MPPLSLTSTTGRAWHLQPERALTPNHRLVRDVTVPTPHVAAHPLVLKTLSLPSTAAAALALDDLQTWARAHRAAPAAVLPLHDIFAPSPTTLLVLTDHCPTDLAASPPTPARAPRVFARVAAALHAVLLATRQPAHANLSLAHVLLDARGNPRLAGWGYARARRLSARKRPLSDRDDVRALAAMLFEVVYRVRWDPARRDFPARQGVTDALRTLMEGVLLARSKDLPQLTVFRYDLAAVRGILPKCTSALAPVVNNEKRERFLGADLDSVRGLEPPGPVPAEQERRQAGVVLNGDVEERAPSAPSPVRGAASSTELTPVEDMGDGDVNKLVRRLVNTDPEPFNLEDANLVATVCARQPHMSERVFKVLFELNVSKNPVVAFKVTMLLHHLLAEGPAQVTALAITHDGFLSWAESEWTRERIPNKQGKPHLLSYCFAAGEIAWYIAALRKRIMVHAKFAQALSTHWIPRPDGVAALAGKRHDAMTCTLGIVDMCNSLLRKIVAAKDPSANLKKSAVPLLVMELAKAYLTMCYVHATADEREKPQLGTELATAHRFTKLALNVVHSDEALLASCPSSALLKLADEPPTNFNVQEIVTALKKKRKKKKKKKRSVQEDETITEILGREVSPEPARVDRSEETRDGQRLSDSEEPREDILTVDGIEEKPKKAKKKKDTRANGKRPSEKPQFPSINRNDSEARPLEEAQPYAGGRPPVPVNGMGKLSLSVRRGQTKQRDHDDFRNAEGFAIRGRSGFSAESRGRSSSADDITRERAVSRQYQRDDSDADSGSDSESRVRRYKPNIKGHSPAGGGHRRYGETGSDPELSRSPKQSVLRRKSKRGGDSSTESNTESEERSSDDEESSEEEEDQKETRPKKPKGKVTQPRKSKLKKPTDEKKIPFDKEPPERKKGHRSAVQKVDADHTGGSKEALAAAASGKKTPNMNPKFEVAPYEVQFGNQVGSGGFGVVFKAKFRGETVAVKKIHAHALSNAASVAEFQSEVAVLCTLRHPNILRFVGACTRPPNLMIITEYMSRGTLFDVLHQSQMRVTWPMRKKFAMDTCKGMRYLHDSKLLHRDLKSSNLMLDKDFNCKVGDFGLTRISRGAAAVQMTGQCGTFQYMAVEVLANKPYSEKADVFSFGILLWEMVSRKLPYFGMQPMQVAIAVLQQGMRPPIPEKCPVPLVKLMKACWDSDPNRRPSFAQLMQALEAMPE